MENMLQTVAEELVKVQPKGLLTIPKRFRQELGLEENTFARIKKEKGRLMIEPVRVLPYPARSYSDQDLKEFFALDEKESKELKKKDLL